MEKAKESSMMASNTSSTTMAGSKSNNTVNDKSLYKEKQINTDNNNYVDSACTTSNCNTKYNQCNDEYKNKNVQNINQNGCGSVSSNITPNSTVALEKISNDDLSKSDSLTSKFNSNVSATSSLESSLSLHQQRLKTPIIPQNLCNQLTSVNLNISTTTGQEFCITVDPKISVENLKKIIAKKFKVTKDRICLLYKEKELQNGTLQENNIIRSSKIIVTPTCESGRMIRRPENSVLHALESLTESQVNDFLSGKIPLSLSMRLGEHMMLIQLQLSCGTGKNLLMRNRHMGRSTSCLRNSSYHHYNDHNHQQCHRHQHGNRAGGKDCSELSCNQSILSNKRGNLVHQNTRVNHCNEDAINSKPLNNDNTSIHSNCVPTISGISQNNSVKVLDQSPIKSLSNLVTNSAKTSVTSSPSNWNSVYPISTTTNTNITNTQQTKTCFPQISNSLTTESTTSTPAYCDPIAANLTSCLCTRLNDENIFNNKLKDESNVHDKTIFHSPSQHTGVSDNNVIESANHIKNGDIFHYEEGKTHTHMMHESVHKNYKYKNHSAVEVTKNDTANVTTANAFSTFPTSEKVSEISIDRSRNYNNQLLSGNELNNCHTNSNKINGCNVNPPDSSENTLNDAAPDARTLSEASRNLTNTLRKLSKGMFTNKVSLCSNIDKSQKYKSYSGAIIETIKSHGKGIYSGTFSGTLNPALQDVSGRPKRDISTVLHILNDLLSAAPQCCRETTHNGHMGSTANTSPKIPVNSVHNASINHQAQNISTTLPSSSTILAKHSDRNDLHTDNCGLSFVKVKEVTDNLCHECHLNNMNHSKIGSICSACANLKTKHKMEQLRLVMQQRKEKRQERKMKTAPYEKTTTTATTANNQGNLNAINKHP